MAASAKATPRVGVHPGFSCNADGSRMPLGPHIEFKVIDFGVATFDELLAQAAGGYESEVRGARRPACSGSRSIHLHDASWQTAATAVAAAPAAATVAMPPLSFAMPALHSLMQEVMQHLRSIFNAQDIMFGASKVSAGLRRLPRVFECLYSAFPTCRQSHAFPGCWS